MNQLVDSFGRAHTYLRISVTDRCNLRCFYCMPSSDMEWQPREKLLTFEEIERVASLFVELGIDKIRITGGEPLVRRDLPSLLSRLNCLKGLKTLAMTTNAALLEENAVAIRSAGISQLNISLDSLKAERFLRITGVDMHDRVMSGIEKSLSLGFEKLKLNVVVIAGVNDDEILDFVEFAHDKPINVRFIEFMPFRSNDWNIEKVVSFADMKTQIESRYQLTSLPVDGGAVAKDFSIAGATGTVSFITSMSDSFCSSCNRVRITADGSIKSCLFYPAEMSIRESIRQGATDSQLKAMILAALAAKPEAHPPAEEIAEADNRAMIQIGG